MKIILVQEMMELLANIYRYPMFLPLVMSAMMGAEIFKGQSAS